MSRRLSTALDAVTVTTTSDPIFVGRACKATLIFTRANHSSGSSTFTVTGSLDGTTYVALNKLITNATNAITEGLVRVASVILSSNTSSIVSLDMQNDVYRYIKVTVTEDTDGTHTCKVLLEVDND